MKKIPLTQGQVALVDDEDYERAMQFKWYALKKGGRIYAVRGVSLLDGRRTTQYLHNFILGAVGVDHRDGDGLNDQRQNIRRASSQQNNSAFRRKGASATSRFRGVCWHSGGRRWLAQVKNRGRNIYLGIFKLEKDAARAYDAAAIKLFGEFAAPNFPA